MPRLEEPEKWTVRETFSRLTVDELRTLLALVCGPVQARKPELVDQLASVMEKKDTVVARTLASDRRLRNICQLAGERHLVFRAADEAAARRTLQELGHVSATSAGEDSAQPAEAR